VEASTTSYDVTVESVVAVVADAVAEMLFGQTIICQLKRFGAGYNAARIAAHLDICFAKTELLVMVP